ncbi:hypothetical protein OIV83_005465 [Microbotryomycetes sp. JL201]|nr:hypothetical protein OIV83_005465 [Microbotryomycetes sp. JL201]
MAHSSNPTDSCFFAHALPPQVSCADSIQGSDTITTCTFPPNGNEPYRLRLRKGENNIQRLYVELHGEAGKANRFHEGGHGASLNGTLDVSRFEDLYLFVGATGTYAVSRGRSTSQRLIKGHRRRYTESDEGVFWARGGGFTSLGTGVGAGFRMARSECALSSLSSSRDKDSGDCRILVAAGGGGAGPSSPGKNAGVADLGMTTSARGQMPREGDAGAGGAGLVGGRIRRGHGGGGGLSYVGEGSFDVYDKLEAHSREALAVITLLCSAIPKQEHEKVAQGTHSLQTVFAQAMDRRLGLKRKNARL